MYHPALLNKAAYALSRMPPIIELSNITVPSIIDVSLVHKEIEGDSELQMIVKELEMEPDSHAKFHLHQG